MFFIVFYFVIQRPHPSSTLTATLLPYTTLFRSRPACEERPPLVLVVGDGEDVRTASSELMLSVGIEAECCASTRDLIESPLLDRAGCLVLDVRMPEIGRAHV